ncbi:hypothetical protein [Listeria costaricensis]|uniref:hypothetical protein n=1 Tax=Listeria costaricensis TaxID=2026604 RepID=UPI000C068532|nr:hypothetical protein [Listeria costaricensis]
MNHDELLRKINCLVFDVEMEMKDWMYHRETVNDGSACKSLAKKLQKLGELESKYNDLVSSNEQELKS